MSDRGDTKIHHFMERLEERKRRAYQISVSDEELTAKNFLYSK